MPGKPEPQPQPPPSQEPATPTPPQGPHATPEQTDRDKTPGAGTLPDDDAEQVEPGSG